MKISLQISLPSALFLIYLLLSPLAFAKPLFKLPPPHRSVYSLSKYGAEVAEMENTLSYTNGTIRYLSRARATGLAKLLVDNDALETSVLQWPENQPLPRQQSFSFFYGENNRKNQRIDFNWQQYPPLKISGSYKDKHYELSSQQPVWAHQLLPLLMSSDLLLNPRKRSNSFYITDKGSIHKYTYTLEKTEEIEFADWEIPTLKFRVVVEGSSRYSYVWLSESHYYLPIRLEQYKNDKLNLSIQLEKLDKL